MSFGRNPFAAKAEAAELKAGEARDGLANVQAWRDAARLWDRAADREQDAKRKQSYLERAEAARARAEAVTSPFAGRGDTVAERPSPKPRRSPQDLVGVKPNWSFGGKKSTLLN